MKLTKLIIFILADLGLAWNASAVQPVPLTCQLTATPTVIRLGDSVKLSLIATGFVDYASIDGQTVPVPTGGRVVTPSAVGTYSALGFVRGTNGEASNCQGNYSVVTNAPVWEMSPILLSACANQPYSVSLAAYAASPSGAALTFSQKGSTNWVKIASDGVLVGTPSFFDVGTTEFVVSASSPNSDASDVQVVIRVGDCAEPSPIGLTATSRTPQAFYLPALTHIPGEYVKMAGPAWTQVSLQGVVTGTPGETDIGANTLQVGVKKTGSGVFSQFSILITVQP